VKDIVVMRGEAIFSVRPWPVKVSNPAKFRWAIYRDGAFVGAAMTKAEAHDRIGAGYYDPAPAVTKE